MNDFRKFATQHLGMNGMVIDDIIKSESQYLNPYILEERKLNVTQMDVFSRLMADRIIFLGTPIDDYVANTIMAQLLYLDSVDNSKDISLYINSLAVALPLAWASMTRCNTSRPTWPHCARAWQHQWAPCCW